MFLSKLYTEILEHSEKQNESNELHAWRDSKLYRGEHLQQDISQQRMVFESDLTEQKPEQIVTELVKRLKENGYSQEAWISMDKAERSNSLQKAALLMSQEMLLPISVRGSLQISFDDQLQTDNNVQLLRLDSRLLDSDDASRAYAGLFRAMQQQLQPVIEFPSSHYTKAYISAKESYDRLIEDMFVSEYQQKERIEGGLSASQGLAILARANFSEASRLRGNAASLMEDARRAKNKQHGDRLQAAARSALSKAASLEQSGRRLAREYNKALQNAQRKKT